MRRVFGEVMGPSLGGVVWRQWVPNVLPIGGPFLVSCSLLSFNHVFEILMSLSETPLRVVYLSVKLKHNCYLKLACSYYSPLV